MKVPEHPAAPPLSQSTALMPRTWGQGSELSSRVEPFHTLSNQDIAQWRRAELHQYHIDAGALK